MNRVFIPALCGALALAGCQTIGGSDDAIKRNLAQACDVIETGHQSFLVLVSSVTIKPSIVATEAQAHDTAMAYCAHPESATTMSAVVTVIKLGAIIVRAYQDAQAGA